MGVLDNKAVVITGGAGVLGSAYAKAMADEGAKIIVNDVNKAAVAQVVNDIVQKGGKAVGNTDSVTSWEGAERIIDSCINSFGQIDCLINSAHMFGKAPIWELQEEALDLTTSVHLKGHFSCTHHAARRMIEQKSGSIITVTSRALHGMPASSPYSTVKAGILGATWTWAMELAEYGVRVNCVSPAALKNPDFKPSLHVQWYQEYSMQRSGQLHDTPEAATVTPLLVYLASNESDWVTGQVIFLAGDTLALMEQPQYRFAFQPRGWTLDDLRTQFRETIGAELSNPGQGKPGYQWYDGVS